ncbi:glutamine synthetase family protein [Microbacterium thalassium]|uniref:Glutamine synthetase n=1 Tax=Microbacterium thalassium TaxID=362649 RepID=A0A7X0FM27_9MICO|nr:glutamine synthetase family protein [Microbacterium thalassium]MBB6389961.1 glutamine synthetase [Microbacterium thalassium]GLK24647.1 glutamine synthetase [Microbacterium thalassium]
MNNAAPIEDAKQYVDAFIKENDIKVFKIGAVDIDGLWRGKRLSAQYFSEAAHAAGTNICNILFGWDLHDTPIPGLTFTGWHTGYPDVNLRPDLTTLRVVPGEPGVASVICDLYQPDGTPLAISPRGVLQRVVDRANALGYDPICAYEFEFYLFEGSPRDLARGKWRDLEAITTGNHTYSVYRDTGTDYVIGEIRDRLAEQGVFIEASNSEHGAGQFEVNIHYGDAVRAADSALILKNTVKEIAAKHGLTATFMAKVNTEHAGSSGHVHQSLVSSDDGASVFANPADRTQLSETGMKYLAGLVAGTPDFTALYLPTINSYKRVEGGQWAGSSATWGFDNRTVAVRSIPSAGPAARVENRVPGADANPYLVLAANIASGLSGIENDMVAPEPITGNAYEQDAETSLRLPNTLAKATEVFAQSEVAKEYFGEEFVRHYVQTREWEIHSYATAVTDWEINRYIEHI